MMKRWCPLRSLPPGAHGPFVARATRGLFVAPGATAPLAQPDGR